MTVTTKNNNYVIQVTNNGMGHADKELRHKLIRSYLKLLNEQEQLPEAIAFYTQGVKLTVEGSPVLEELEALAERGVLLIICGTCLNYFGLFDKVKVGIPSHMPDIIELQQRADKVITL